MRLQRSARQGRPSRSRIVAAAAVVGGLAPRTTAPTRRAGWQFIPRTSRPQFINHYTALGQVFNGDLCVAFDHQYNLTGASMADTPGVAIEGSDDISGTTIYEGTMYDNQRVNNATYEGHQGIGSYITLSDDPYVHLESTNSSPNTTVVFMTAYDGSTVDGEPTLIEAGYVNDGSGRFTMAATGTLTFPVHEVPAGYEFLYVVLKRNDAGTTAAWFGGATAIGEYKNTLGYDTYSWAGSVSAADDGDISVALGTAAYPDIELASGYAYAAILAIPGV